VALGCFYRALAIGTMSVVAQISATAAAVPVLVGLAEGERPSTLASNLSGAGSRWSEGQLRLRIVDARRLNPATIMPSYHRVDGLQRVGSAWQGKPVLDAQQVEDVVAFLRTLRD